MGLFRKRSHKGKEGDKGPTIEEVEDSDQTPSSNSQPTVEEPDDAGNYASRGQNPRNYPNPSLPNQSPFDSFFREPMMDGFGGFGPMDPFGGRTFGGNPFAMHHSLFDMGPSMFGTDPFMNDSMGGFLMGPEAFQSPFRQQTERKNRSQSDSQIQRQRQNSGQDQFAYQFQSWSSTGNGSGERIERHFSARGSTDDNMHHVSEAVRNKDGRLQSRQESIPFGQSRTRNQRPAIANT